jgi:ABC-type nitrate/sulfonate/bicarbonate transport system ATPase subunit
VVSPALLLLDEPMSALDYMTKQRVRDLVKQIHRRFSPTVIHVTHDIEEALFSRSDRYHKGQHHGGRF